MPSIHFQPPLAIGTLLLKRYQLLQVLGQGGFGRTYLAQDHHRFSEYCVLKEFFPADSDPAFLAKARSLFQREARVLYDLRHPQIPEFREQFEFDQRLFLVQQHVPGKTYAQLLQERLADGSRFSEVEIRQFLSQTLPVLTYLHQHHIIHRDIAPDNIIQRETDHLPVLIDFGAVKELARCMSQPAGIAPTLIGKPAYAPPEQMQTGKAQPSSDLYALAATAIVLLTGKPPDQLYDAYNCRWQWQETITVSRELTDWLNQMLHPRPEARFHSAVAALSALQSLAPIPLARSVPVALSQLPTQAVGQRPIIPSVGTPPQRVLFSPWLAIARPLMRLSRQLLRLGLRLGGRLLWWLWRGISLFVPRWVLILALITSGYWGYRQLTGQPLTLAQRPDLRLPRLPSWPWSKPTPSALPQGASRLTAAEVKRREALLQRLEQLGVPATFFYEYVDAQFGQKHPNLAGKGLSASPQDQRLREDWYRIGETLLQRLERLNPSMRQKLGQFTAAEVAQYQQRLKQLNLPKVEFERAVEQQFQTLFPNGRSLPDRQAEQLKQAIAGDYLTQLEKQR